MRRPQRPKLGSIEHLLKLSKYSGLHRIIKIIKNNNAEARFVGGCVRNALIGMPINDIDVATEMEPQDLQKILISNNIQAIATGIKHGTITAVIENNSFEITTLRTDLECDGRHAKIQYTTNWKKDAFRRDFTFNALYADEDGNIYDYNNGLQDLKDGFLRFMGNAQERIEEDYLRILRAFRFHLYICTQPIPDDILKECYAQKDNIDKLSGERIREETMKILHHPNCFQMLKIMQNLSISIKIFGQRINIPQNITRAPNMLVSKMHILASHCANPKQMLAYFRERWKINNKLHKSLWEMNNTVLDPTKTKQDIVTFGKENYQQILDSALLEGKINAETHAQKTRFCSNWELPILSISGEDIMKLGISTGKKVGLLLKLAKGEWSRQEYKPGKQELIEYVKRQISALNFE